MTRTATPAPIHLIVDRLFTGIRCLCTLLGVRPVLHSLVLGIEPGTLLSRVGAREGTLGFSSTSYRRYPAGKWYFINGDYLLTRQLATSALS